MLLASYQQIRETPFLGQQMGLMELAPLPKASFSKKVSLGLTGSLDPLKTLIHELANPAPGTSPGAMKGNNKVPDRAIT